MHHGHNDRRAIFWILILTSSYMVIEFFGGVFTGSLALVADAGHMFIDVLALLLGAFAVWISERPPTDKNTFGFYRAEILAALINGALLISVSIGIFIRAWSKFLTPTPINAEVMTLIASGGLLVNLIAITFIHRKSKHNLNFRGVWFHLLSDTIGSISATMSGILTWNFAWGWLDPIISILIALLILRGAVQILTDSVGILLEAVPKGMDLNEIRSAMANVTNTSNVHDLHIWAVTNGMPALSAHVQLKDNAEPLKVLSQMTVLLKEKFHIEHVTLQLEPPEFTHPELHL